MRFTAKRKQRRVATKSIRPFAIKLATQVGGAEALAAEHMFLLATDCFTNGQLRKAERLYRRILTNHPSHSGALHNLGLVNLEKGKEQEALHLLREAVALRADDPTLLTGLGLALRLRGQRSEAAEALLRALNQKPDYNPAYKELVTCIGEDARTGVGVRAAESPVTPAFATQATDGRRISVIVCSIDIPKEKKVTENYETLLAGTDHELIVINDARSLCEAYNRGIDKSTGDILVFSHDDIEIVSRDFKQKLLQYLDVYDMVAVAGTDRLVDPFWGTAGWPYVHGQVIHRREGGKRYEVFVFGFAPPVRARIQAVDGLFFAVNRHVVETVRFDEERFDGFHFYDIDFSFSAFLAGFKIAVCIDILVIHDSKAQRDDTWKSYAEAFERKFRGRFAPVPFPTRVSDVASVKLRTRRQAVDFCERIVQASAQLAV